MEEICRVFESKIEGIDVEDIRRNFITSIVDLFLSKIENLVEVDDDTRESIITECFNNVDFSKKEVLKKKIPVRKTAKSSDNENSSQDDDAKPAQTMSETWTEGQCSKKYNRKPNKGLYCSKPAEPGILFCKGHQREGKAKTTTSNVVKPRTTNSPGLNPSLRKGGTPLRKGMDVPVGLNVNPPKPKFQFKIFDNENFIYIDEGTNIVFHSPNGDHAEGGAFAKAIKVGKKIKFIPLSNDDREKLKSIKMKELTNFEYTIPSNLENVSEPPFPEDFTESKKGGVAPPVRNSRMQKKIEEDVEEDEEPQDPKSKDPKFQDVDSQQDSKDQESNDQDSETENDEEPQDDSDAQENEEPLEKQPSPKVEKKTTAPLIRKTTFGAGLSRTSVPAKPAVTSTNKMRATRLPAN